MRLRLAAVFGAAASGAIGIAAYRSRSLDAGGAAAAVAVGTATFAGLEGRGAAVLLAFFVSSVALTRVGKRRKAALDADIGKGGARDARQVLANGGVAALCALAARRSPRARFAFAGAFAAATADTWATEIGTLAARRPRSILTLRPIATGFSGGVTLPGTLAELAGALLLGGVARACFGGGFSAVWIAGAIGATVDSVLGASLQALRFCPDCSRATERAVHDCGTAAPVIRGAALLDNDAVNLLATLAGAGAGWALAPRDEGYGLPAPALEP